MKVNLINESGYDEAILGLSLSFNKDIDDHLATVAMKLSSKDGGHNKFLETITIWLDITAPRYWWQQFDTYRVGITKQSESTMHTLLKKPLTQNSFEHPIDTLIIGKLNRLVIEKQFDEIKNTLPEGFLQRRIDCTNYKVLRNMIIQRRTHKLKEWQFFINSIREQVNHSELLPNREEKNE